MQFETVWKLFGLIVFGWFILHLSEVWEYRGFLMKIESTKFIENGRHSMVELQFKKCTALVPDTHEVPEQGMMGWVHAPNDFTSCYWLGRRLDRWPFRMKHHILVVLLVVLWFVSLVRFSLSHCTCLE